MLLYDNKEHIEKYFIDEMNFIFHTLNVLLDVDCS